MNCLAIVITVCALAQAAGAQTRLIVPSVSYSPNEDTQLLASNNGDQDTQLDLWAFSSKGDLIGQYQMTIRAHGTRSVTLGEAFRLGSSSVQGWLGAVSQAEGVQLSYTRIGETSQPFDAGEWSTRETLLNVNESGRTVVHIANPNSFGAKITVQSIDANGSILATQAVELGAFGQRDIPTAEFGDGRAARLSVISNSDIVTTIDETTGERITAAKKFSQEDVVAEPMALTLEGPSSIGAYQVTLSFDPSAVQFSAKDIAGGDSEGFDSKPLVVNVDNVAGLLTIGSFQVGARPAGQSVVARLNVTRRRGTSARFSLHVDEITDLEGNSLVGKGLSVGLVRTN